MRKWETLRDWRGECADKKKQGSEEHRPERWYRAALWPQWERQLGRERRLLASTERAAITAPIMLPNYPWSTSPAAGDAGLDFKTSSRGLKLTGACVCVCVCFLSEATFKNLFELVTPRHGLRDGNKKKRGKGSNSTAELLTFHITHFFYPVCLTTFLPPDCTLQWNVI